MSSSFLPDKNNKPFWKEDFVYTVGRSGLLRVFDASDPQRPVVAGELELTGELRNSDWLEPHFLLIAAGQSGLHVVNVEDPCRPDHVATLALPEHLRQAAQVMDVHVVGRKAYLAHHRNGISQVDVSDPLKPRILRAVDTPGVVKKLASSGEILFASIYRDGLFMIDLGGEGGWAPVGVLDSPIYVHDLAACQGRLVVRGGQLGGAQLAMPLKLEVRVERDDLARIKLPDRLEPGAYRLYLYNDNENLQIESAFHLPSGPARQVAQNE
jgi:hypothetical protein